MEREKILAASNLEANKNSTFTGINLNPELTTEDYCNHRYEDGKNALKTVAFGIMKCNICGKSIMSNNYPGVNELCHRLANNLECLKNNLIFSIDENSECDIKEETRKLSYLSNLIMQIPQLHDEILKNAYEKNAKDYTMEYCNKYDSFGQQDRFLRHSTTENLKKILSSKDIEL